MTVPEVVIIGGGFGGLYAARALNRAPVRVTLIDRKNHHVFQPLLYQVATGGLSAPQIAAPIRHILRRQKNTTVLLAEVVGIDVAAHEVELETGGSIHYDFLILAAGATHAYFGHEDWAAHAPGLKTIEDAFEIRRKVFLAFESAELATDPAEREAWLTFVIVGGGATGVELAGALAEISRHTIADDFRRIDPRSARIILIEGTDRVLPPYPPELSERAEAQLRRLGVDVRTSTRVTGVDAAGVSIGSERIAARTTLWAAGVAASPLAASLGVPLDRAGRVLVGQDLTVPGHPEISVIGDLAAVPWKDGWVPGVSAAAIQEGRLAALNIRRAIAGLPREPFEYWDKGSMATIGRKAAVGVLGRLHLSGFVAWLAWLLIHITYLAGFRNRLVVLVDWAWAYLTYERGARLILDRPRAPALGSGESHVR